MKYRDSHLCVSVNTATHPSTTSRSHLSHKGSAAPDQKLLEGLCTVQKKTEEFQRCVKVQRLQDWNTRNKNSHEPTPFLLSSFCFLKFFFREFQLSRSSYNKRVHFDKERKLECTSEENPWIRLTEIQATYNSYRGGMHDWWPIGHRDPDSYRVISSRSPIQ